MTVRQIRGSFATVVEVLAAAAETNPDVEAYIEIDASGGGASGILPAGPGGRRSLTFSQWAGAVEAVSGLLAAKGVRRGDVVCLALPSSIDYAVAYHAAARLGAVTTGINLRLGAAERASILSRVHPTVTIFDAGVSLPGDAAASLAGGVAGTVADSLAGTVLSHYALHDAVREPGPYPVPAPPADLGPDDPVAIVWTSGSTGVPKGALFTHRALEAVALGTDVLSQPGDRRLSPLPFAHVGYMTRAWDEMAHGITTVITPHPWNAAQTARLLAEERVTVGQGVPTQWALVLDRPELAPSDELSLRIAGTGAARVPPDLVRAMRTRLGCPVVVRYTSTETSLGTGTAPGDDVEIVAASVGRPVPGVELAVVRDDGTPAPVGEVGRVRLRSGAAMRGYVARAGHGVLTVDDEATADVLDGDGWVTTGDLGALGDDGNLRLAGRVGEMYIRGGYNVYPAEVEAVLGTHPSLSQVAVVGVEDPVLGEIGACFAVPASVSSGASRAPALELEGLREWCAVRMADYKAPDRLYVVEELPLTAMSKVDTRALRERARAEEAALAGSRGAR
ncbi:MAG: class I adenylate-forming enzyme family protein [Acidimicrobiales bacterium]